MGFLHGEQQAFGEWWRDECTELVDDYKRHGKRPETLAKMISAWLSNHIRAKTATGDGYTPWRIERHVKLWVHKHLGDSVANLVRGKDGNIIYWPADKIIGTIGPGTLLQTA